MITLEDVIKDEEVEAFVKASQKQLNALGYTEHSYRHIGIVSKRTGEILQKLGYDEKTVELGKIAGYLHDIGNCVNRTDHAHSGAILAYNILKEIGMPADDRTEIVMAIGNHDEYKKFYGNTYCNDYKDYICLMQNGELMKPGYVTQTFSKILDNNNLRHIRLHDLRHSCGTLLIQNGVPVKDIQIWLGHSNFQTTLRYAHADIENKKVSANVIENKLALDTKDTKKEQITKLAI